MKTLKTALLITVMFVSVSANAGLRPKLEKKQIEDCKAQGFTPVEVYDSVRSNALFDARKIICLPIKPMIWDGEKGTYIAK